MKLTIRTFTEEVRELVHRRIREVTRGVAVAAGLPEDKMPRIDVLDMSAPPNYNDPDLVGVIRAAATKVIGADNVREEEPKTVAEDFARYGRTTEKVPTALFNLGTVGRDRYDAGIMPGLHTAGYFPDPEPTLMTGVEVVTQILLDLFKDL